MKRTPSPKQRAKAALKALIVEAGNPGQLAQAVGAQRSAGYVWEKLPDRYLKKACEVFDKDAKELRPDLSDFQIKKLLAA